MQNGAQINVKDRFDWTLLMMACHFKVKLETIKFMVENGADIYAVDLHGRNALYYALNSHDDHIINYLSDLARNSL